MAKSLERRQLCDDRFRSTCNISRNPPCVIDGAAMSRVSCAKVSAVVRGNSDALAAQRRGVKSSGSTQGPRTQKLPNRDAALVVVQRWRLENIHVQKLHLLADGRASVAEP